MPTLEQLQADLADLQRNLKVPHDVVFPDGSRVTRGSVPELLEAEASLLRKIADLNGTRVHTILIGSSKGLE